MTTDPSINPLLANSHLTARRLLVTAQMSTTKVPEVRDITRIERIGEESLTP